MEFISPNELIGEYNFYANFNLDNAMYNFLIRQNVSYQKIISRFELA